MAIQNTNSDCFWVVGIRLIFFLLLIHIFLIFTIFYNELFSCFLYLCFVVSKGYQDVNGIHHLKAGLWVIKEVCIKFFLQ